MAKNLKEGRSARAAERGAILSNQNAHSEYTAGQAQRPGNIADGGYSGVFGDHPASPSTDVTAAGQTFSKIVGAPKSLTDGSMAQLGHARHYS